LLDPSRQPSPGLGDGVVVGHGATIDKPTFETPAGRWTPVANFGPLEQLALRDERDPDPAFDKVRTEPIGFPPLLDERCNVSIGADVAHAVA
jgi:hypothetical protein